ncbi:DUF1273 domain-containing protein [Paenibacillus protaetiae]|uniref:DUF1273 domain-containing protein n=1 Tax=Paenibacillus protaetiae TaxID=2509456 RepID=A0A4P6ETH9_9BACL|nr:DUF1273 domain-containing protein [Paenibacillus protaetiae]QAY65946.1 DUF1273 domain-containing protein [Paenibacillus protaetiae]
MKNILATGYRAHELGIFDQKHKGIPFIKKAIEARLLPLAENGLEWVITPGQYGADLWACEVVIAMKRHYPDLKLSILAAYEGQEARWKEDKQQYYREIVRQADYYGIVSKQPYNGVWQLKARDELLFRKTDGILLFYDEDSGEASPKYMKQRAWKKHVEEGYGYIGITAEDVQDIANEGMHGEEWA